MSKIFETLNRTGGPFADLIKPLVADADAPAAGGGPEIEAPAIPITSHLPNDAAAVDPLPLAQVRTAPLRVSAPSPLLPFDGGHWLASEQYRILRTKVVQHSKQPRLIVVSSPAPGDGKSVSAINLAATLSLKSEARVLVLDADFRKSAVHAQLGLPKAPGLSDVLRGRCPAEEALVNARELPNLYILCAGAPADNPSELLDSSAWPALCAKLRTLFRYVIVDSPPMAAVADFELIQATCDGVILVARPDHTHRQLLSRALELVAKPKFLGLLLNCVPDGFLSKRTSADYYYYSKHGERRAGAPSQAR